MIAEKDVEINFRESMTIPTGFSYTNFSNKTILEGRNNSLR